jgi:hypothetical protein
MQSTRISALSPDRNLAPDGPEAVRELLPARDAMRPPGRLVGDHGGDEGAPRPHKAALDSLRLLDEIRTAQHQIAALVAGTKIHGPRTSNADLEGFLAGLGTAWRSGRSAPRTRRSRDHRATGGLERIRSRRYGRWSSRGWKSNRIAQRRNGSSASRMSGLASSRTGWCVPCNAAWESGGSAPRKLVFGPAAETSGNHGDALNAIAAGLSGAEKAAIPTLTITDRREAGHDSAEMSLRVAIEAVPRS